MKPTTISTWADWVAFGIFVAYSGLGVVVTTALLTRWGPIYSAVASRSNKPEADTSDHPPDSKAPSDQDADRKGLKKLGLGQAEGNISLSKLQMFMWTFVLIFAWLYRLVKTPDAFPELPNQALLLMGISGAAYLGAKQQGIKAAQAPRENESGQK